MKYTFLSGTNIKVSKICLGTMTFGEQNSEMEAHDQLDFALEHGVNFIDTAELYAVPSTKENNGKTEDYIGTWLNSRNNRDQVILATKVTGPTLNREYIAPNLGFSRERISHAINRSLRRLQTDYVDLYQLHWPERNTNRFGRLGYSHNFDEQWSDNIAEVTETLNDLIKDGKIRQWGLSNETPWGTMRFLDEARRLNLSLPVSVQNAYNLVNRAYEIGMSEVSMRENIGLLAYSPLGMGSLSGKYVQKLDKATDRLNKYDYFIRYRSESTSIAISKYIDIAAEAGISTTELALSFVNHQPFVTSNIIGATNLKQLEENINSIDIDLDESTLAKVEEVHRAISNPAP